MKFLRNEIELMAPVGSFESLTAAIQAGTDSVYFGVGGLNMRSGSAANFSTSDIAEIIKICQSNNVKSYLTLNTVIYDDDIDYMYEIVNIAKENGISAIIASDLAVINYSLFKEVPVHCSTQLNISNVESVRFFSKYSDVIVLARELNLRQVRRICETIKSDNILGPSGELVRIEMFIHGALCMAISGKCYLSLHLNNKSANRGECLQPCRREYEVLLDNEDKYIALENENNFKLSIDNKRIMSPKDLCTISFLDKIIDAGARVLKIEGRGRSPEYVKRVVDVYNIGLEAIIENKYTDKLKLDLTNRLKEVYNRGFWDGYYLGQTLGELAENNGSIATKHKEFLGIATNYFSNIGVGEFLLQTGNELKVGDEVLIIGSTTGVLELKIEELHNDVGAVDSVKKGMHFAIPVPFKIRKNDKIYKLFSRE